MSYSSPCVSFSSSFYSCSWRTVRGEIDAQSASLISAAWVLFVCRDGFHRTGSLMLLVLHSELFLSFRCGVGLLPGIFFIARCELLIFWSCSTTVTFGKYWLATLQIISNKNPSSFWFSNLIGWEPFPAVQYSSDDRTPTVSLFVSLRLQYFSQRMPKSTLIV